MTTPKDIPGQLASSLDRNDEAPNVALAERICQHHDREAVAATVHILQNGSRPQQSDAIKVLYEIGARAPDLILPHVDVFFACLESQNNRIVWGALTAIAAICARAPDRVARQLTLILSAADKGSVIAKDRAIEILTILQSVPAHAEVASSLLLDRLRSAPVNQLPTYAERTLAGLPSRDVDQFVSILEKRLHDDMPQSKRKRLTKVIAKALTMTR